MNSKDGDRRRGPSDEHTGSTVARLVRSIRHSDHTLPLGLILLCLLLVNGATLLHILSTNPLQLFANLQVGPSSQFLPGQPTIDPNAGVTTQALGHLAAHDLLHGQVPWWNPYEGVGSPLAGEMQSASFFPFTLLQYWPAGWVPFHLLLEVISGWSTYFLLRRLGTGRVAATTSGVAFGLCGMAAWFAFAAANPLAFLPMALLGAERCYGAARSGRSGGWVLLVLALALSILAGFPEVAYLDGLLVVLWCVVRAPSLGARFVRFAGKLLLGGALAIMICAPLLIAFLDYLPHANVGGHGGTLSNYRLPLQALPQILLPYVHGPIFALNSTGAIDTIAVIWGGIGGYLSAALLTCALIGLVGKRHRPLRIALGAWTAVMLLKTFGVEPVQRLVNFLPGFHEIATFRYAPASWEMAMVVLAGLGVDDVARRKVHAATVLSAGGTGVLAAVAAGLAAWPSLTNAVGSPHRHVYDLGSTLWAVFTVMAVVCGGLVTLGPGERPSRSSWRRRGTWLMGGVVILDAMVLFSMPLLSAPRPQPVDMALASYLKGHLGPYRFVTLGPITPNYGSYFGISEVNIDDLPVPKSYSNYIRKHLDPNTNPLVFSGTFIQQPTGLSPSQELSEHLDAYEAIGVKYVVVPASGTDSSGKVWPGPGARSHGVDLVYSDAVSRLYELPSAAALMSATTTACSVTITSWDSGRARCARPATLVWRELELPGWTAMVDNRRVPVKTFDGIFQKISLPAGETKVVFSYTPPHVLWGVLSSLVAVVVLVSIPTAFAIAQRRRHRESRAGSRGIGSRR